MDDEAHVSPQSLTQDVRALREVLTTRIAALEKASELGFANQEKAISAALAAAEKAVSAALSAADRAVAKAEASNEARFQSMNEFRGQLADQARDLMPRKESEASMSAINEKLDALTKRVNDMMASDSGGRHVWGYVVGATGVLVAIVAWISDRFVR